MSMSDVNDVAVSDVAASKCLMLRSLMLQCLIMSVSDYIIVSDYFIVYMP